MHNQCPVDSTDSVYTAIFGHQIYAVVSQNRDSRNLLNPNTCLLELRVYIECSTVHALGLHMLGVHMVEN